MVHNTLLLRTTRDIRAPCDCVSICKLRLPSSAVDTYRKLCGTLVIELRKLCFGRLGGRVALRNGSFSPSLQATPDQEGNENGHYRGSGVPLPAILGSYERYENESDEERSDPVQ